MRERNSGGGKMLRGVRGATTVLNNNSDDIIKRTYELLNLLIVKNNIKPSDVTSIFISMTADLNTAFPAKALRKIDGWTYVPVMCMSEVCVPGSIEKCIRVMIHIDTSKCQQEICHLFLHNAKGLRPDLEEGKEEE